MLRRVHVSDWNFKKSSIFDSSVKIENGSYFSECLVNRQVGSVDDRTTTTSVMGAYRVGTSVC